CRFVPEYGKLISVRNIQYPYCVIPGRGGEQPTIGAKCRAVNFSIMNSPAVQFFPALRIPHSYCAIGRCTHDPLAIWAECGATRDTSVAAKSATCSPLSAFQSRTVQSEEAVTTR